MVEANRAAAVAMSEGPAAGLVILDAVGTDPAAGPLAAAAPRAGGTAAALNRPVDAAAAYQAALQLEPPLPERAFIGRRLLRELEPPEMS